MLDESPMKSPSRTPATEIEITPAMIEAGVEALGVFDGGYMEAHEDAAERIFLAMWHAKEGNLDELLHVIRRYQCRTCYDSLMNDDQANRSDEEQERVMQILSRTDCSGKKTEYVGLDDRKAEPPNIDSDTAGRIHWQKCYRDLWKLKITFEKEHNGRVGGVIDKNNSIFGF